MVSEGGVVSPIRPALLAGNHEAERGIVDRVRDTRGKFLTVSLFHETIPANSRYKPLYTLRDQDKPGLPSARRIYLDLADPTEYKAAMALLGSWEHWSHLCSLPWFAPQIEAWRAELRAKLKSRAVEIAREVSTGNDAAALSAAKWLHAQLTMATPNKGGRPKKPVPVHEVDADTTNADYERLMEKGSG